MSELHRNLETYKSSQDTDKVTVVSDISKQIEQAGYSIVEVDGEKPWGAYFRIDSAQADTFVGEFFPDLTPEDARLGVEGAELSPKILLVSPGQRLSWQYHDRRAERWMFLSDGAYNKSMTDEPGDIVSAAAGDVVQFATGERHRLVGLVDEYTLVAEIWQHSDASLPSNESDIVRLSDDYSR